MILSNMKKIVWAIVVLAILIGGAFLGYRFMQPASSVPLRPNANAAGNEPSKSSKPVVGVKLSLSGGTAHLADSNGMTLYYFAKDAPGQSNCPPGPCLDLWPAFSGETLSVESPLLAADFSAVSRADGAAQTAYKGWPLYYFANDKKPGDMLGQGSLGVWLTVPLPFYTVLVMNQAAANGSYLADAAGRSLYAFKNDTIGTATSPAASACVDACAGTWPPFAADKIVMPPLLSATDIAIIIRPDGSKQLTYKGQPLYYYSGDADPSDLKGQGIDGFWFAAAP
jgi:predicted lipoprotein with Yx(FWY)xxD motif